MVQSLSARRARVRQQRQVYFLLASGGVLLIAALLFPLNTSMYPIGVLVLGLGMLIAAIINPLRLVAASSLLTPLGLAVYLAFRSLIPGNQVLAAYILALGLGLLVIALMARRGYIRAGAVTPGLIVSGVGIVEALLAAGLTPPGFIPFMLSLWLPGSGLLVLGLLYLFMNTRK